MHAAEIYDIGGKKSGPQESHEEYAQHTQPAHPAHTVPAFAMALNHPFTSGLESPQRDVMPYAAFNTMHPLWPFGLTSEFSAVAQTAPAVFSPPLSSPQEFIAPRPPGPQCATSVSSAGHIMQAGEADSTFRDSRSLVSSGSTQQYQLLCATAQDQSVAPWIACEWHSCGGGFYLDERSLDQHLRTHPQPVSGEPARCEWNDCTSLNDLWNVKRHVWDSHLGLRWICERCCRADFQSRRSRNRHEKACQGASAPLGPAVRCAHCTAACGSQAEMNQHAPACPFLRSSKL